MSGVRFLEPLVEAQIDGTAYANSTTATSLIPAAAKFTLPANFMQIGRELAFRASGRWSTTGTPTFIFEFRLGSVALMATAAVTLGSGITNIPWILEAELTCRAIGASANMMWVAKLYGHTGATAFTLLPTTSPVVGANFVSTDAAALDLFGTWSAASASNTCTLHQYRVWSPN